MYNDTSNTFETLLKLVFLIFYNQNQTNFFTIKKNLKIIDLISIAFNPNVVCLKGEMFTFVPLCSKRDARSINLKFTPEVHFDEELLLRRHLRSDMTCINFKD